jgi:hypothetical protein
MDISIMVGIRRVVVDVLQVRLRIVFIMVREMGRFRHRDPNRAGRYLIGIMERMWARKGLLEIIFGARSRCWG